MTPARGAGRLMDHLPPQSVVKLLASRMNIAEADAARFFQSQAELALEHAAEGFTIPGVGVLCATRRPAQEISPALAQTVGAPLTVPARTAVTFRISSVVRHALLRRLNVLPDVTCAEVFDDLQDMEDQEADRAMTATVMPSPPNGSGPQGIRPRGNRLQPTAMSPTASNEDDGIPPDAFPTCRACGSHQFSHQVDGIERVSRLDGGSDWFCLLTATCKRCGATHDGKYGPLGTGLEQMEWIAPAA